MLCPPPVMSRSEEEQPVGAASLQAISQLAEVTFPGKEALRLYKELNVPGSLSLVCI